VRGDICTTCCGTEREVSVDCPFDCPYLHEAHKHARMAPVDPESMPDRDLRISEEFLEEHQQFFASVGRVLVHAALDVPGAVDHDVHDALHALVRTYRTLESGVYYETRPENALAGRIYERLQEGLRNLRESETKELGMTRTRDADVLLILAFLSRLEFSYNNGRPRGRAFLGFLWNCFVGLGETLEVAQASSLIIP
jgi:hypothetical protein